MQVLKENIKNNIILATTHLIVAKGIDQVTMRMIAKECNMTVGNLYRYFKNKDEIIAVIIEPVLGELNTMLTVVTDNQEIKLNEKIEVEQINYNLNLLVSSLAEINSKYELAMRVLASDENFNQKIVVWLSSVIRIIIKDNYELNHSDELAQMLAMSLITGVNTCFSLVREKNYSLEEIKQLLANFLEIILGGNFNELY